MTNDLGIWFTLPKAGTKLQNQIGGIIMRRTVGTDELQTKDHSYIVKLLLTETETEEDLVELKYFSSEAVWRKM